MAFTTMWLELRGMSHSTAAMARGLFDAGTTAGSALGGWVVDRANRWSPAHGRVAAAQFSVGVGIPLWWLVLFVLPKAGAPPSAFGALLLFTGLCITWCNAFQQQQRHHHHQLHRHDRHHHCHHITTLKSRANLPPPFLTQPLFCTHEHLTAYGWLVRYVSDNAPCRCGAINQAVMSEVVPPHIRTTVYSLDRAFEGTVGLLCDPLGAL